MLSLEEDILLLRFDMICIMFFCLVFNELTTTAGQYRYVSVSAVHVLVSVSCRILLGLGVGPAVELKVKKGVGYST